MKRLIFILFIASLFASCDRALPIQEGYFFNGPDSLYFQTIGEGKPLVVIHGGPVLDHQYLLIHFLPLAESHQLIFYDQRVCGRSQIEIPPERMTFNAMLNDIEALKEHLKLEEFSVLGHSWGGLLAMMYATQYDDHIEKLILSNSMAPSAKEWNQENIAISKRYSEDDQMQLDKLATSGLLRSKEPASYIDEMMLLSYKSQFYDVDKIKELSLHITNDYHLRSSIFMNLASEINDYDLFDSLQNVKSETLIIYGEIEPAQALYLDRMVGSFPQASSLIVERSGHFPFIEQPEAYFERIEDFLK